MVGLLNVVLEWFSTMFGKDWSLSIYPSCIEYTLGREAWASFIFLAVQ